MRLYLVRHAEAAQLDPDELRPLTAGGREAARTLGRSLAADGIRPDVVLTSPLLRARETADEIARATGTSAEPDERLAPGATLGELRAVVAGRGEQVVVVGHQPDCGRIAAELGGHDVAFAPGAMHVLELEA